MIDLDALERAARAEDSEWPDDVNEVMLALIARLRAAEAALEACRDYATDGASIGAGMTERERLGGVWAQSAAALPPPSDQAVAGQPMYHPDDPAGW